MLRLEQYNVYMSIHDETTGAREDGGGCILLMALQFHTTEKMHSIKVTLLVTQISGTTWTFSRII